MTWKVGMLVQHPGSPRDAAVLRELAAALDGADVGEPDEVGVFEVTVEGGDQEEALLKVWDAVAASGADDHVLFLEHADLPEHWRRHSGSPA